MKSKLGALAAMMRLGKYGIIGHHDKDLVRDVLMGTERTLAANNFTYTPLKEKPYIGENARVS